MRVKSAKGFRLWYKNDQQYTDALHDEDFIGSVYRDENNIIHRGFFSMFHGDKDDVSNFLGTYLKIAEDGQAIYEFLQNAEDCGSTQFHLFYDEECFLAVNNGEAFNLDGLHSILNAGQSTKKDSSKIGRFGIGFKLVHRLVGEGDGLDEIVDQGKGPVLFSWKRNRDLVSLANAEEIEEDDDVNDDSRLPFLLKMVLTCFPAGVGECVRDLDYRPKVFFSNEEYKQMARFVSDKLGELIDGDDFNHGSLFFIRLGKGKKALLDKDCEQNFSQAIKYSLCTMRNLASVSVNGVPVSRAPLAIEAGSVSLADLGIHSSLGDAALSFAVGFNKIDFDGEASFDEVKCLKAAPSFYKYFPLADEMHHSAFFVHCDGFSSEANRRKLHDDNVNQALLPYLADFIIKRMEYYKEANYHMFLQLYANALLSDAPTGNAAWAKGLFYDRILDYLRSNVPTKSGLCACQDDVFIRGFMSAIADDSEAGEGTNWFLWDEDESPLAKAAADMSKLGLKRLDVADFVLRCESNNYDKVGKWVEGAAAPDYKFFCDELFRSPFFKVKKPFDIKIKKTIGYVRLFRFSDGQFDSWYNMLSFGYPFVLKGYGRSSCHLFRTRKLTEVEDILLSLDVYLSDVNVDDYQHVFREALPVPDNKMVFERLSPLLSSHTSLPISQKVRLVRWFKDIGIADDEIGQVVFFKTVTGRALPLRSMVSASVSECPDWLKPYRIAESEYDVCLDSWLIQGRCVYANVIFPNWKGISSQVSLAQAGELYNDVKYFYMMDDTGHKGLADKSYVMVAEGDLRPGREVFFSSAMLSDYAGISSAIRSAFEVFVPVPPIAKFLTAEPFKTDDCHIESYTPTVSVLDEGDVRSLIAFARQNREQFFEHFVIDSVDGGFILLKRGSDCLQAYAPNKVRGMFIKAHCSDVLRLLPMPFNDCKEQAGVLSGDQLMERVLDIVRPDVDDLQYGLLPALPPDMRPILLRSLSSIVFDLDKDFSPDCHEALLAEAAIKNRNGQDDDNFRGKCVIVKGGERHRLTDLPPLTCNFGVEGGLADFNLSQVLPSSHGQSAIIRELVDRLVAECELDDKKEELEDLLGSSPEVDVRDVAEHLVADYTVLQNAQQLAFAALMRESLGKGDPLRKSLGAIKVQTKGGQFRLEETPFYAGTFSFICENYILDGDTYAGLKDFIGTDRSDVVRSAPYISKGEFVCDGLNENLAAAEVADLLTFLDKLRRDGCDLSSVKFNCEDSDISKALGFDPRSAVLSNKYALKEELVPQSVRSWMLTDDSHERRETLAQLGVQLGDSPIVKLRMYLSRISGSFDDNCLDDLNEESLIPFLKNTLLLLCRNDDWRARSKGVYDVLRSVVKRIEKYEKKHNRPTPKIKEYLDFDEIEDKSEEYENPGYEAWKKMNKVSIFFYDGEMPYHADLYLDSSSEPRVVWTFSEDDYCVDTDFDDGSVVVYINKKVPFEQTFFNVDKVNIEAKLDLFSSFRRNSDSLQSELDEQRRSGEEKDRQISSMISQISDLQFRLQEYQSLFGSLPAPAPSSGSVTKCGVSHSFTGASGYTADVCEDGWDGDKHDSATVSTSLRTDGLSAEERCAAQLEAQRALKNAKPKWRFEEGFATADENGVLKVFSTSSAVDEDGNEVLFVIKSYRYTDKPLLLTAEECAYCLNQKATLFLFRAGSIKVYNLIDILRRQSHVTISYSTENLNDTERIRSMVKALRYFKDLHIFIYEDDLQKEINDVMTMTASKADPDARPIAASDDDI